VLDRSGGERPPVAGEEDVIDITSDRPRAAVGEVVRQAGLGDGLEGNEPLLAALASDPEVAVGRRAASPILDEGPVGPAQVGDQRTSHRLALAVDRGPGADPVEQPRGRLGRELGRGATWQQVAQQAVEPVDHPSTLLGSPHADLGSIAVPVAVFPPSGATNLSTRRALWWR